MVALAKFLLVSFFSLEEHSPEPHFFHNSPLWELFLDQSFVDVFSFLISTFLLFSQSENLFLTPDPFDGSDHINSEPSYFSENWTSGQKESIENEETKVNYTLC